MHVVAEWLLVVLWTCLNIWVDYSNKSVRTNGAIQMAILDQNADEKWPVTG